MSASTGAVRTRTAKAASSSGLSRARLAWLQATNRRRWALSLWLCLTVAIAIPALLPLIEVIASESALADTLARNGSLTVQQNVVDVQTFSALQRNIGGVVTSDLGANVVPLAASVTVGPFPVVTLNGAPPRTLTAQQGLRPSFLDHLSAHVSVVAGELPPDGLGGGDTAVTMPQSGADQLGFHLSDRFCLGFTGAQEPSWCARLVGLWQPAHPQDPYWAGRPPRMQLAMGRYDFFQLLALHPPQPAVASFQFEANPTQIDTATAPAVARRVTSLATGLRQSGLHVVTSLDRALERFAADQRAILFSTRLVAAAIALLGLLVVAVVSARFLDGQTHDLGVLRARGWSRRRAWQLAFAGPATLAVWALPAGLAGCVAVVVAASFTPSRISLLSVRLSDLAGPALAVAASFVGLVVVLAASAARATPGDAEPKDELPLKHPRAGWRGAALTLLLALLGAGALGLLRLPGFGQLASTLPAGLLDYLPAVPALGVVLVAVAVVRLRPLRAFTPRRRANVSRLLAARQLERCPEQHTTLALVLDLSAAIGVFAAAAFVIGLTSDLSGPLAVRSGAEVGLAAGALGALTLALAAFAFHLRWAARRRLGEYGGLFAHGLPTVQVSRSLAAEQGAITASSLIVGGLLGAALAAVVLPLPAPTSTTAELAAAAAAAYLLALLLGTLAVGSVVRRLPAWVNPLSDPWLR